MLAFVFLLFVFFTGQFFANSLKTEQVVVKTDDLIYSRYQIVNTKKEFCYFEKGMEFDFLKKVRPVYRLLFDLSEDNLIR